MKFLGIVFFSILAAIAYGVVHDQITAHLCVEYFTIGHPRLIDSDLPTVLGLFWGVVGTWWVGAGLGVALASASRLGKWPKLEWKDHRRGVAWLLAFMGAGALIVGGITAYAVWDSPEGMAYVTGEAVPQAARPLFMVDAAAHLTSYGVGFLGGVVLVLQAVWRRFRMALDLVRRESLQHHEVAK